PFGGWRQHKTMEAAKIFRIANPCAHCILFCASVRMQGWWTRHGVGLGSALPVTYSPAIGITCRISWFKKAVSVLIGGWLSNQQSHNNNAAGARLPGFI